MIEHLVRWKVEERWKMRRFPTSYHAGKFMRDLKLHGHREAFAVTRTVVKTAAKRRKK